MRLERVTRGNQSPGSHPAKAVELRTHTSRSFVVGIGGIMVLVWFCVAKTAKPNDAIDHTSLSIDVGDKQGDVQVPVLEPRDVRSQVRSSVSLDPDGEWLGVRQTQSSVDIGTVKGLVCGAQKVLETGIVRGS